MKVHLGLGAKIQPEELDRADLSLLYSRFEQLAKNALIREEHNDMAYHYIKNLMITDAENPYHIRDRGLVLAQMGAYPSALKDLEFLWNIVQKIQRRRLSARNF